MKLYTERKLKNSLIKEDYQSTKQIFERLANEIPNQNIIGELNSDKKIIYHTSIDILNDIENIGNGLIKLGLEGKHIAIACENQYRYLIVDMAICGGVGVSVPIDKDAPNDLTALLINKSDVKAIFISDYLLDKMLEVRKNCPQLTTIIIIDNYNKDQDILTYEKIIKIGKNKPNYYHNKKLDLNATCEILFTSGTTGNNKGVELSQTNICANIANCIDIIKVPKGKYNTSMSILPYHHATEVNTHVLYRIACGRLVYINGSVKDIFTNIKIFKPGMIVIVPMIASAICKQIWANARKSNQEKKLKRVINIGNVLAKIGINIKHLLLKKVYTPFGRNLKEIISGGAPLNPEVVRKLNDLDITMVNGYGITECGPLISMNVNTKKDAISVGKICPRLKTKIVNLDENRIGELCIKGSSVAKGYYKDEKATQNAFMTDGFFHTGDYAQMENNNLILTGRKKNIIVLENGKNVYPEEVEVEIINTITYIKEVVLYQENVKYLDGEKLVLCAGVYIEDEKSRTNITKIKEDFIDLNKKISVYKRVLYIELVDHEFEKTSTKKIKRDLVIKSHTQNGIRI